MLGAAEAAQVEIPAVVFFFQTEVLHRGEQHVEALLALRTADQLTDAGDKHIHRGDGLAVLVLPHVERLDLARVVGDEHRLAEDLLGEVALMLGLEVDAPGDRVVKLIAALLEQADRLGVGHSAEVVVHKVLQSLEQRVVEELVEEGKLLLAGCHDVADDVLDHRLGDLHVILEVGKRHLGLHHPELGGVTLRVGALGAEGRTEGVDIAEREGKALGVELTRDGQAGRLAEEVLGVVDAAVLVLRQVVEVERGHAEHFACALAVRGGDDRRVDIDKAAGVEELMDGKRALAAHAEDRVEGVGARAQMRDRAQELEGVLLLLKRVFGGGNALDLDGSRLQLKGLLGVGSQHQRAVHNERRADILLGDLGVVFELVGFKDDLQVPRAAAVVQLDEAEGVAGADGACPAADGDRFAVVVFFGEINAFDLCPLHFEILTVYYR